MKKGNTQSFKKLAYTGLVLMITTLTLMLSPLTWARDTAQDAAREQNRATRSSIELLSHIALSGGLDGVGFPLSAILHTWGRHNEDSEQQTQNQTHTQPTPRIEVQQNDSEIIFQVSRARNTVNYRVSQLPEQAEVRQQFLNMSEQDRRAFQDKRIFVLTKVTGLMHSLNGAFGVGMITSESIRFRLQRMQNDLGYLIQSALGRATNTQHTQYLTEYYRIHQQTEAAAWKTMQEKSQELIQTVLTGLNQTLFNQSALVARGNEFGTSFSVGLSAFAGTSQRGVGGTFNVGVSIGVDYNSRSLTFQVYRDIEKYRSSILPIIGNVGGVLKASIYLKDSAAADQSSQVNYPPVPVYAAVGANQFQTGLTLTMGLLPPAPLDQILAFRTSSSQAPLFGRARQASSTLPIASENTPEMKAREIKFSRITPNMVFSFLKPAIETARQASQAAVQTSVATLEWVSRPVKKALETTQDFLAPRAIAAARVVERTAEPAAVGAMYCAAIFQ